MKYPIFYRDEMSVKMPGHRSQSTAKPSLFTSAVKDKFVVTGFDPASTDDFELAHTRDYVDQFFSGGPISDASGFPWSAEYADSVRYTTGSLMSAIKYATDNKTLAISPVSGFHHAMPKSGMEFCAMSGQVVASVDLYKKTGISGAYVDLDAHYGNSIDDTYKFQPALNKAIPRGMNINPTPIQGLYFASLEKQLKKMRAMLESGELGYVVLCHGADSCIGDDLEGFLSYDEWIRAGKMVAEYAKGFPLVYTLFGGYRENPQDIIDLHVAGLDAVVESYSSL